MVFCKSFIANGLQNGDSFGSSEMMLFRPKKSLFMLRKAYIYDC